MTKTAIEIRTPIQKSGLRRNSRQASAPALRGFWVSMVCGWPGAFGSPCGPRAAVCSSLVATVSKSLLITDPRVEYGVEQVHDEVGYQEDDHQHADDAH